MKVHRTAGLAAVVFLGYLTGAAAVESQGPAGTPAQQHDPKERTRKQQEPDEPKALELRVRPRATQGPATIRVTAIVERHAANREITLEAESGGFLRSSSRTLEGADAPTKYTRIFAGLPPGTYEVTARLERNDGTEILDTLTVEVFGRKK